MKKLFLVLLFSHTALFAQQSIECQIMRQKILEQSNAPNQCQVIYQQCLVNARYAQNMQIAQSQCAIGLGACQMGGALSGDSLQQAIQQYKNLCEK